MVFPSVYDMTNIARSATLDENYSSGWTSTDSQVTVSSNQVNFSSALCGTDRRVYKPLGFTLDDRFVVEWEFSLTDSGSSQAQPFALTAGTAQLDNSTTNQDSIYFKSSSAGYQLACKDGTSNTQSSANSYTNGTTLYARLVRSGTSGILSIYSDSARTTLVNSATHTIPETVTGLNTLQHGVDAVQSGTRTISGTISNVNIWNGVDNKTARRQHFWEYFSGATLNSRWTALTQTTSFTATMSESVDGGVLLTPNSGNNGGGTIAFADKKTFAHNGSVFICNAKRSSTTNFNNTPTGFSSTVRGDSAGNHVAVWNMSTLGYANFFLKTCNNSGQEEISQSTVPIDTDWHKFKLECKSSSVTGSIDGLTDVTCTDKLPTIAMQPICGLQNGSSGTAHTMNVNYVEAYNT